MNTSLIVSRRLSKMGKDNHKDNGGLRRGIRRPRSHSGCRQVQQPLLHLLQVGEKDGKTCRRVSCWCSRHIVRGMHFLRDLGSSFVAPGLFRNVSQQERSGVEAPLEVRAIK